MNKGVGHLNLFFAAIMSLTCLYFMYWGIQYTEGHHPVIFICAAVFGLFMAFNIGGNDVANSFGTSVGAGTLTITQALCVAAVFEISGAVIAGGEVTDTIRKGIVDLGAMHSKMEAIQFVYVMMSALIAAAFWLLFATKKGWPVSTTHAIIGGIVGSAMALGVILDGIDPMGLVKWNKIGQIVASWIISPLLGGLVSFIVFGLIKRHVLAFNDRADRYLKEIKSEKKRLRKEQKKAFESLSGEQKIAYTGAMARDARTIQDKDYDHDDLESDYYRRMNILDKRKYSINAYGALQAWVPLFSAVGAMVITAMLLFKGLKHMDLHISTLNNYLIMAMVGASIWMATFIYAKTLKGTDLKRATFLMFSWMQVFTASGFAFSHGSNDIANAVGPFAAILDTLKTNVVGSQAPLPTVVMLAFGISLVVGLWFIGKNVIATVGTHLTKMHPSSGFAAELSAAVVVMLASTLGLPVSSTHILVGAVLGVGLVNKNANWALMKPIGMAWVVTVPAAAAISVLAFLFFQIF